MTITEASAPAPVKAVPALWEEYTAEGVQIIRNLKSVQDAEVRIRRHKPVDARALGCKLINDHFNGHLVFRGVILKMVSNGSIKEDQRAAAVHLVEQFLATVR